MSKWELYIKEILKTKGHEVKVNTEYCSCSLLINNKIKACIKISNYFYGKRSQFHAFNISKKDRECDVFICIGLDEEEKVKRCLVIPRKHLKNKTSISCGVYSRHDTYNNAWDHINILEEEE